MNKKGLFEDLKEVLLALVGVVVIIGIVAVFSGMTNEAKVMSVCRASLVANDKYRAGEIVGVETAEKIGINCPPFERKIKKSDLEDAPGAEYEDSLNFLLAEELRKCKSKTTVNEKPLKPFSVNYFEFKQSFCLKCSSIEIDEKVQKLIPKIQDPIKFLERQKMPGDDRSYLEYLTGKKKLADEEYEEIKKNLAEMGFEDNTIDTSSNLATIYMIVKTGKILQLADAIAGAGALGTLGCLAISAIPIGGWLIGGIVCGSSIIAGGLGGYYLGTGFTDETTTYILLKEEEIVNLGCDKLYQ